MKKLVEALINAKIINIEMTKAEILTILYRLLNKSHCTNLHSENKE
jgi:hypothetical protein